MNYRSLFIVTFGRTGSTLLQGMLNSIEGVVIRGEGKGFLLPLFHSFRLLEQGKKQSAGIGIKPEDPYYGINNFDDQEYLTDIHNMVKKYWLKGFDPDEVKCFGYKEVTYLGIQTRQEFNDYLDWLHYAFPQSGFLFLTRELDHVIKSGMWKKQNPLNLMDKFVTAKSRFAAYAEQDQHSFQITYEDMIAKNETLQNMFQFLGIDFDEELVDKVLDKPHSVSQQKKIQQLRRLEID